MRIEYFSDYIIVCPESELEKHILNNVISSCESLKAIPYRDLRGKLQKFIILKNQIKEFISIISPIMGFEDYKFDQFKIAIIFAQNSNLK